MWAFATIGTKVVVVRVARRCERLARRRERDPAAASRSAGTAAPPAPGPFVATAGWRPRRPPRRPPADHVIDSRRHAHWRLRVALGSRSDAGMDASWGSGGRRG